MYKNITIQNRQISDKNNPLVVLEISANHGNSLHETLQTIDAASSIGAECIKFQTFNLDDMTLNKNDNDFIIKKKFKNNNWNNRSLYDLYSEAQLPLDWHEKIFKRARSKKLICFSSVFDEKSLVLLEKLNCPAYKIASLESLHFPLIEKVIKTKKPLIVSTGTLTIKEIDSLISFIKKKNFKKLILLHCVSDYPANYKNINLKIINYIKDRYNCLSGFSDHTQGLGASIASAAMGANLIEKHFMLKKNKKNLDSDFSLTPTEAKILIREVKNSWASVGTYKKKILKNELLYKKYRRSIYSIKDIKKGDFFSKNNIAIIRPGFGGDPRKFNKLLDSKSKKNYKFGARIKT